MKGKLEALEGYELRVLRAAEIRSRVESIAEELAERLGQDGDTRETVAGIEVLPIDNRQFVTLMSSFIMMN